MPRFSLTLLVAGLVLVATGYVAVLLDVVAAFGPWGLASGSAVVLTALLRLSARRSGRIPRALHVATVVVLAATAAGFGVALLAPPATADGPLLLGLPRITAILLLLVGLVPLVVLPAVYARAFDRDILSAADLERVRAAAAATTDAAAERARDA
jgi:hypothetical protein